MIARVSMASLWDGILAVFLYRHRQRAVATA
jgi:hypothetical protein